MARLSVLRLTAYFFTATSRNEIFWLFRNISSLSAARRRQLVVWPMRGGNVLGFLRRGLQGFLHTLDSPQNRLLRIVAGLNHRRGQCVSYRRQCIVYSTLPCRPVLLDSRSIIYDGAFRESVDIGIVIEHYFVETDQENEL